MPLYRKKPVVVEAMQFTQQNIPEIRKFAPVGVNGCRGVFVKPHRSAPSLVEWFDDDKQEWPGHVYEAGLLIPTLEGNMLARENDWIIKGVQGEFYPCKPGVFNATYEPIPTEEKSQ